MLKRKKSTRIREAKKTIKGQSYYDQLKRKSMRKMRTKPRAVNRRTRKASKVSSKKELKKEEIEIAADLGIIDYKNEDNPPKSSSDSIKPNLSQNCDIAKSEDFEQPSRQTASKSTYQTFVFGYFQTHTR
jgi:hypothetical protein